MSSFLPEQWRELEERMREIAREEIAAQTSSGPTLDQMLAFGRGQLAQIYPQSSQSPAEERGGHEAQA